MGNHIQFTSHHIPNTALLYSIKAAVLTGFRVWNRAPTTPYLNFIWSQVLLRGLPILSDTARSCTLSNLHCFEHHWENDKNVLSNFLRFFRTYFYL